MEINSKTETEQILKYLVAMAETTMELGEKIALAEKYICFLRSITAKEARTVIKLKNITKHMTQHAMKAAQANIKYLESLPTNSDSSKLRSLYERLHCILEKESQLDDIDGTDIFLQDSDISMPIIMDKITGMESKLRSESYSPWSSSFATLRLHKQEVNEKYPESCSKECLLNLESGTSLPPVPEDAFTNFKISPRSRSLSSIKTMTKMKHNLKQYEDYDEDDNKEKDADIPNGN